MDGAGDQERAAKPQRRPAGKAAGKVAGTKPVKQTLQLRLDCEVKRKLEAHALGRGCTCSALVEELVRSLPTEWVLSRRSPGGNSSGSERSGPLGLVSEAG